MKAAADELNRLIDAAIKWLMDSGVQNDGALAAQRGGYNAWYEQDTKIYPFVYSEITGYLITLMCALHACTGDERFLRSATAAGDWLLNTTREPSGGFRCLYPLRPSRFDFKKEQMYAFDVGVVLNGLVALYRASRREKYLAAAVTAADWLAGSAQKPSGSFSPIYQLNEDRFLESDKEWSMWPGSHQAKIAIGLLNLHDLTETRAYRSAATKVCDFALGCQDGAGRFVTFMSRGGTNAHPHCYTAEALWAAGTYLEREDYLEASARGTRWLLDHQSSEGYVPRLFFDDNPIYAERMDANVQALRLATIHLAEERLPPSYEQNAEVLLSLIPRYHAVDPADPRANGGFFFGRESSGEVLPHVNTWLTAFAIQALQMWVDRSRGQLSLDPFLFV